jgi:hypothetical protein
MANGIAAPERKEGTIYSWVGRWGILIYTFKERYFLHISEFDAKRLPVVGETVTFETALPFPTAGGPHKLPRAVNVKPAEKPAITPELVSAEKGNEDGVL